jgi:UDP-N-acetylglucosamine:LPS N-acetylglucosamine transferase
MKKIRKIKYLFVGMGPGETGQARALAKYISKQGEKILFTLHQEKNLHFLSEDKEFQIFLTKTPGGLKKIVEKEKPQVLLLFNSKMWGNYPEFYENPPFPKTILTLGVDSNWLFDNKKYTKYKFIEWLDKYLVLFPEKILNLGLKKNGGDFFVPKRILKKIIPVGFIPSYQKPSRKITQKIREKYKIKKDEKFIFSYFSGFGAGHRVFAFNNLISAVDKLVKKGRKIKVLYIGPIHDLDHKKLKKNWLLREDALSADQYFLTLSQSDLVFQHQGMVTLSQAIASKIPVICNVHILKDESLPKLHFWEVSPFKRAGVCEMFSQSTSIAKIAKRIDELLFNYKERGEMQKKQRLIWENGEEKAFKIINHLFKEKI